MSDLVKRLRGEQALQQEDYGRGLEVLDEAADEIEKLTKERDALKQSCIDETRYNNALRSALESAESVEPFTCPYCKHEQPYAEINCHNCNARYTLDSAPAVPEVEKYRETLEMARDVLNMNWAVIDTATKQEALRKIEEVLK